MGARHLRSDIPINLPETFKEEARGLRNKLLLYRFHRRFEAKLDDSLVDQRLEPRLNQILLPLLSVVPDEQLRAEFVQGRLKHSSTLLQIVACRSRRISWRSSPSKCSRQSGR